MFNRNFNVVGVNFKSFFAVFFIYTLICVSLFGAISIAAPSTQDFSTAARGDIIISSDTTSTGYG